MLVPFENRHASHQENPMKTFVQNIPSLTSFLSYFSEYNRSQKHNTRRREGVHVYTSERRKNFLEKQTLYAYIGVYVCFTFVENSIESHNLYFFISKQYRYASPFFIHYKSSNIVVHHILGF